MFKKLKNDTNKEDQAKSTLTITPIEAEENDLTPDVRIQMETFSESKEGDGHDEEDSWNEEDPELDLLLGNDRRDDQHHRLSDIRQSNNDDNKARTKTLALEVLELPKETLTAAKNTETTLSQVVSATVMAREYSKRHLSRRNSAVDNRIVRLNTRLLDAIEEHKNVEVESILEDGANPNATCRGGHVSACHVAAYCDSHALRLLLKHNADINRVDKLGRTPLHFASWAGNNSSVAMLLGFPAEVGVKKDLNKEPEAEEELKRLNYQLSPMIDVPCELSVTSDLAKSWKDSIEHKCRKYMSTLPEFPLGWTPLHVASYAGHGKTTRLLLAAGANPNSKDSKGLTPLDVAGSACFQENWKVDVEKYVETLKALMEFGGKLNTTDKILSKSGNALHTAVQMCSVEAIQLLLEAGASIAHRNSQGNTPLHECVVKRLKEPLQELAKHSHPAQTFSSVDVTDSIGYTVLQTAVVASWIPGVCVALEAGADVTFQADDGYTAIHLAARKGNIDILNEILNAVPYKNISDLENMLVETPLFRAIRSGNLACVQTLLDAGASLKLTTYHEPKLDKSRRLSDEELKELNMIVHATAEVGHVEILEFLLNYDNDLEKLLDYRCPYLKDMLPVEFAAHHENIDTYRFLMPKSISSKIINKLFDPSRLLDILVSKNRDDMFRDLLSLVPDAVRVSIAKGHYPLHNAIKHCDRNMILLLINNGADLSQRDESGDTAISLFSEHRSKPTEFIASIFDSYIYPSDYSSIENHNFEVVVDYCALIPTVEPSKEERQMRVLEAILETGNRNDQRKLLAHPLVESFLYLKWQTLSTFYYMLVSLYSLFVLSLSIYVVSVFYYVDKKETVLFIWHQGFWKYVIYVTLGIIIIQEISCTTLIPKSWKSRIFSIEFWVKLGVYGLAFFTPLVITIDRPDVEWLRHLASLTLVLAWLMYSLLLSKAPLTGYYMQMFWNVFQQIIGILLSFLFLIALFSLCFMIEFHFEVPFDGPWAAFVKTLVMMTSEFDYGGTFTNEIAVKISTSIQMLRVIFVVFLVLTAIVLMNLMTGIAVHDVQNLILDGNLRRLDKQVGFLNRLEISRGKKSFFNIMGMYRMLRSMKVPQILKMNPAKDDGADKYKQYIKQSLMNKAQEQMAKLNKDEKSSVSRFDEILQAFKVTENNLMSQINDLKAVVVQLQKSQQHIDR